MQGQGGQQLPEADVGQGGDVGADDQPASAGQVQDGAASPHAPLCLPAFVLRYVTRTAFGLTPGLLHMQAEAPSAFRVAEKAYQLHREQVFRRR